MASSTQTHLVFGANGALGSAIVRQLVKQRQPVRAIVREIERAKQLLPPDAELLLGNAMNLESVRKLFQGVSVVYPCLNVPYQSWAEVMPVIIDNIISAARECKCRIVFPGNVYGYGRFQTIPFNEEHPLAANTKKGKLRNQFENQLWDAHRKGEVEVVIPRMPDFYGINVTNKLYAPLFEAALEGKSTMWLGNLDVLHDLLFIDDAAAACVLLGSNETAYGQVWHVSGAGPLTGRQFIKMIFQQTGKIPRVKVMGRGMVFLMGLFSPTIREINEILYQFEEPQVMNGTKFTKAFPDFKYTPHEEAIHRTLDWFRKHHQLSKL